MKLTNIIACATTLTFVSTGLASAQNPISPAGVYIADPSARVGADGRLYIYGSLDVKPTSYCSNHYHILSTSDMKTWTLHRDAFAIDQNLYAPDGMTRNGIQYLYYDTPDGTEWVAQGKTPTGPFNNMQKIEGPEGIDPCVFVDDDGQAYYFWGQFSAKGAKMNADMTTLDWSTYTDGLVTEKDHYFHEGSFVFKRNGWYYLVYTDISRNERATCIGYSMSRSPLGPYTYKGIIIDNMGCDFNTWNNHGSVAEFNGQWYVFYHRSTHGSYTMRKCCAEPITFREDGTIPEVEMTTQGAADPLDAKKQTDAARTCYIIGGATIHLMQGTTDHEYLANMGYADRAAFRYLDFGQGCKKMTIRLRSTLQGSLSVSQDKSWGPGLCSLELPTDGKWKTIEVDVPNSPTGIHAIWLYVNGKMDANRCDIDWFRFE